MNPTDLAARYTQKLAAIEAEKARTKATLDAQRSQLTAAMDAIKSAMEKVAIPYLASVKAAFPAGDFDFVVGSDALDGRPLILTFRIADGLSYRIDGSTGAINVTCGKQEPSGSLFEPIPIDEPMIATPGDLTEKNLGEMIEDAIDEA